MCKGAPPYYDCRSSVWGSYLKCPANSPSGCEYCLPEKAGPTCLKCEIGTNNYLHMRSLEDFNLTTPQTSCNETCDKEKKLSLGLTYETYGTKIYGATFCLEEGIYLHLVRISSQIKAKAITLRFYAIHCRLIVILQFTFLF